MDSPTKKKVFEEPNEKQHPMYIFDCVLFGIETKGKTVIVGGGGGSAKTGMENKVYLMNWMEDRLINKSNFLLESDALNSLNVHPKDKSVVMSAGSKIYQISFDQDGFKDDNKSVDLKIEGEDKEIFVKYTKDGKEIIAITNSGKLVTLSKEDLEIKEEKDMKKPLTSIDTSHCGSFVFMTNEDGECKIWNRKEDKFFVLKCPFAEVHKKSHGEFRGGCFSKVDEDDEFLYTYQVYMSLKRSYITKWKVKKGANEFKEVKSIFSTKFQTCISSNFNGKLISCGNSDGDVTIFTHQLDRFMHCSPHKLFVSSVAFLGPNVLSISGDRILYVSPLKKNSSNSLLYFFAFLILIFAILFSFFK
eukprot:TRINITY_DN2320_c0_g1_i1.p1 TRINITY_DN2320_c0_g1~~TRINITY_DN2320_c0_g1_i1.p1  ORF type:complete len:360 (-),score=90.04 TRINITY_DN2320_c0_g1_i1:4-1083(-)